MGERKELIRAPVRLWHPLTGITISESKERKKTEKNFEENQRKTDEKTLKTSGNRGL